MEEDMEGSLSAFAEGEWDSADINFLNDDVGFMMHQLFNDKVGEDSSSSSVAPAMWFSLDNHTNLAEANQSFFDPIGSFYRNSYHTSSHCGFNVQREVGVVPSLSHEKYYIAESDYLPPVNNIDVSSEFCMMDVDASPVPYFWNAMVEEGNFIDGLEPGQVQPDILSSVPNLQLNLKRKVDITTFQPGQQDITSEIPKKKPRATKNAFGRKGKAPSKKTSLNLSDDEAINTSSCRQMSSSYSSEDDSNASQELNAGTSSDPKLFASHDKNVKKSGRRGSAIDPQSLYARKRRERINERLRILQNLVPNGTKVDISTMLEEAVNYVKFLQTQIKLLSSDDMWMYAPIAYNGVDIGLDRNLSRNL